MSTFLLNAALPSEILGPQCDDTLVRADQKCFPHMQAQIWYKVALPVQTFLARIVFFSLGCYTRSDIVSLLATYLLQQPDLTQFCLFIVESGPGFHSADSVCAV